MRKFLISVFIGILAGVVDVIPMIIQGLDWYSNISAFIFWIVTGVVIAYISLPIKAWLKGLMVAVISALPIMILVFAADAKSVIPMIIMSAVLGSLVGLTTSRYAREKARI
ncbi:MAG: hypothetical protein PHU56_02250 [Candidatus Pacebacteria bacterium]|nr:hypothetical protein [Candidatus Paceibacterota bacterium]